jgi:hypothetical protein
MVPIVPIARGYARALRGCIRLTCAGICEIAGFKLQSNPVGGPAFAA